MIWAFENERSQSLLADVLATLPVEDRAVVQGRLTVATDDRGRALAAGGDVAAKSSVSPAGVLWFDSTALLSTPAAYQRAVLAHECAHLYLGHHRQSSKALSWEAGELAAVWKSPTTYRPTWVSTASPKSGDGLVVMTLTCRSCRTFQQKSGYVCNVLLSGRCNDRLCFMTQREQVDNEKN